MTFAQKGKLNFRIGALSFSLLFASPVALSYASATPTPTPGALRVLLFAKAKPTDSAEQRERAQTSVARIREVILSKCPEAKIDFIAEAASPLMRGEGKHPASSAKSRLMSSLKSIAESSGPEDTVIVYTHTHGIRPSPARNVAEGGLVVRDLSRQSPQAGILTWSEYARLLLQIPAKNVIVLTMSCFSGGLVEYLKSPPVYGEWTRRYRANGRNIIVLTSQNSTLPSGPVLKDGRLVNPFAHAATQLLASPSADASTNVSRHLGKTGRTASEIVQFMLRHTRSPSEPGGPVNNSDPQVVGSYDPDAEMLTFCDP